MDQLGVSARVVDSFLAEFIEERFVKQLIDEDLVQQLYPAAMPGR